MKTLTIFYDPHCGLCSKFKHWLLSQAAYVALDFLPFDSVEARSRCPGLPEMRADKDIVVMADDGRLWQGPRAWITCLWTLREYRPIAFRLANPLFLPLVAKACYLLSVNRLKISRLLRIKADDAIATAIDEAKLDDCDSGACALPSAGPLVASYRKDMTVERDR